MAAASSVSEMRSWSVLMSSVIVNLPPHGTRSAVPMLKRKTSDSQRSTIRDSCENIVKPPRTVRIRIIAIRAIATSRIRVP